MTTDAPQPPRLPLAVRAGSTWCWEPLRRDIRQLITVTEVFHNGEEWWIRCEPLDGSPGALNELDRFVEAAVLVRPPDDTFPR